MDKIDNIMHLIRDLTDEDIELTREMIRGQLSYINPLKMAKTREVNRIGKHNKMMVDHLVLLRDVINDYDEGDN